MRIKRFNEGFDPDYIQVGDFEKTIEVNSPTYGKYFTYSKEWVMKKNK